MIDRLIRWRSFRKIYKIMSTCDIALDSVNYAESIYANQPVDRKAKKEAALGHLADYIEQVRHVKIYPDDRRTMRFINHELRTAFGKATMDRNSNFNADKFRNGSVTFN